ncbi:MAG: Crp/Fnr family transcriptional regulator [Flammeovirgaceae bacterium]|nr:Crp/Fnr family transcriptional regulator [Flammeovirgaceae bacterium]
METKNFYLKSFQLAHDLSEQQIQELGASMIQKEAKKGQVVYAEGGEKKIFLLVSGKVKISEVNSSGDEMIKELVLPGDLFGDVLLHYEGPNYEYAEVISERAIYFAIGQEQMASMMRSNYSLTINYMVKVNEKFKSLENRYVNMVTKDVKSRLIFCFKEWARREGKKFGDKIVVKNSLTHNDLANLISTSRQTVTVILNELKESGDINYNRREIEFSPIMLAS